MKRLFTYLLLISVLGISSCAYDDTSLWEKVNNHENRIAELEQLCKQMNSNITAMQTLLNAMEENNYITSVTPVVENGETVGYTISFTKSEPITIYHGKNGTVGIDGISSVIGVKEHTDGLYYWTLNGEWLRDAEGKMIAAEGVDGITPIFKIENDYWHISYDNGATWRELGKAKGEDGVNYCEFFEKIEEDENYVYFTLIDGSSFQVLKDKAFALTLDVDRISYTAGTTYNVGFSVTGATDLTTMEVIPSNNLRAYISNYKVEDGVATGYVTVEMPKAILEYATVAVIVSDGRSKVLMKAIHFDYADGAIEEGIIYITNGEAFNFPKEGGEIEVNLQTNISYRVELEERTAEWLSVGNTRSTLREESLMLYAGENKGEFRHGFVYLVDISNNHIVEIIYVSQNSDEVYYEEVILFADTAFESYMISSFDLDKDGVVTKGEALSAETIAVPKSVADLTGLEYCVNLKSLSLASNTGVTALNTSTFPLLEILNISGSKVATIDLSHNPRLRTLNVSSSALTALDVAYNNELESLSCNNHSKLTNTTLILENHPKLTYLSCMNSKLTLLNISGCPELTYLKCSSNSLSELYVHKSPKLEGIEMQHNDIREIDLSKSTELTKFNCSYNEITSLNMQACMKLYSFTFSYNPLTSLNMGALPRLKDITVSLEHNEYVDFSISGEVLESLHINIYEVVNANGATSNRLNSLYCNTPNLKTLDMKFAGDEIDFGMVPSVETIKLTANGNLYDLDITKNPNLKNFTISSASKLTGINFSDCYELTSLTIEDCSTMQSINVSNLKNLTFATIYNLVALTNLNLSGCTSLTSLSCENNDALTSLNASGCVALTTLSIDTCRAMQSINASNLKNLTTATIDNLDALTKLNLTGCSALTTLTCTGNANLPELDCSGCSALTTLACKTNDKLLELDCSGCSALTTLTCTANAKLPELDCSDCTSLKTLTIEDCSAMQSINVSNLTNLNSAEIINNDALTSVGINGCSALSTLDCYGNQTLPELDCSGCVALTTLNCYSNDALASLNISDCVALKVLKCYSCAFESLDISNNTAITSLDCSPNENLTTLYMKEGHTISSINNKRSASYIPDATEIIYK